jgi:N-acetylneuraminic acid mutarotase
MGFGRVGGKNYNDLWEYDPMTEVWTELDSLPGVGRAHPALIAGSGKIWVGLGSGPNGNMKDWWEYDIATNMWEEQPDLPSVERHHPYYFEVDGLPYVGFGHGAGIFRDFYRFDFENDLWIPLDSFPDQGRVAGTQFSYGGKGYILSGQGEDHNDLETGEFWEYDPETDTWKQLVAHPEGSRWAPGSFVLNDEVFVLCGNQQGVGNLTSMWRADLPEVAVATQEVFLNTELKVVPNPASDFVAIQSDIDFSAGAIVTLISLEGKVLMTLDYVAEQLIDIGGLADGIYFLKVSDGKKAQSARLVIAR